MFQGLLMRLLTIGTVGGLLTGWGALNLKAFTVFSGAQGSAAREASGGVPFLPSSAQIRVTGIPVQLMTALSVAGDELMLVKDGATKKGEPAKSTNLSSVVGDMVSHAEANDQSYFVPYLDASDKGKAGKLIDMIKRSGMQDNYAERLQVISNNLINLDYYYPEKFCYFQVELRRTKNEWQISRIWFTK